KRSSAQPERNSVGAAAKNAPGCASGLPARLAACMPPGFARRRAVQRDRPASGLSPKGRLAGGAGPWYGPGGGKEKERRQRPEHMLGAACSGLRYRALLSALRHFSRFYGLFSRSDGYPLGLFAAHDQQRRGARLVKAGHDLGVLVRAGDVDI